MLGVDPDIASSALRLWVAAGSAALLAVCWVMAFVVRGTRTGAAARAGFVILGAIFGAALTWAFAPAGDASAERRVLEMRAQELNMQMLAPGSPLACLDGLAGESVEAACEREIFASPASVAAAVSYTAARLALFSDLSAYAERGGANIDDVLLPLRRSLEADRFGFLAHVLAMRDGCTSENCKAFPLLRDASRVRANLSDAALDHYVEHYLPVWAKPPDGPVADATPVQPSATAQSPAQGPHMVNIDFPTAASIPPVSIMSPEPKGPVLPGVSAAAAANPNPPPAASSSPRRARKQAVNPPPQGGAPAAASGSAAAVEPIWPEPVPPPPQTGEAPAGAAVRAQ